MIMTADRPAAYPASKVTVDDLIGWFADHPRLLEEFPERVTAPQIRWTISSMPCDNEISFLIVRISTSGDTMTCQYASHVAPRYHF